VLLSCRSAGPAITMICTVAAVPPAAAAVRDCSRAAGNKA